MSRIMVLFCVILFVSVSVAYSQCNYPTYLVLQNDPNWTSRDDAGDIMLALDEAVLDAKLRLVERIIGGLVEGITLFNNTTRGKVTVFCINSTHLLGVKVLENNIVDSNKGLVCSYIEVERASVIRSIEINAGRELSSDEYDHIKHLIPPTVTVSGIAGWTVDTQKFVNGITVANVDARRRIAERLFGEFVASCEKVKNFVLQERTRSQELKSTLLIGGEIQDIKKEGNKITVKIRLPKVLYIYSWSERLRSMGLPLTDEDYGFLDRMKTDTGNYFIETGFGIPN